MGARKNRGNPKLLNEGDRSIYAVTRAPETNIHNGNVRLFRPGDLKRFIRSNRGANDRCRCYAYIAQERAECTFVQATLSRQMGTGARRRQMRLAVRSKSYSPGPSPAVLVNHRCRPPTDWLCA
jgi:hypothetical protein